MRIKQFRSVLAIATVAISIAASVVPAQAFTLNLDEVWANVWNSALQGLGDSAQPNQSSQSNSANNEIPQSGSFNNGMSQLQIAPQKQLDRSVQQLKSQKPAIH
jgi:hypothetical protein